MTELSSHFLYVSMFLQPKEPPENTWGSEDGFPFDEAGELTFSAIVQRKDPNQNLFHMSELRDFVKGAVCCVGYDYEKMAFCKDNAPELDTIGATLAFFTAKEEDDLRHWRDNYNAVCERGIELPYSMLYDTRREGNVASPLYQLVQRTLARAPTP